MCFVNVAADVPVPTFNDDIECTAVVTLAAMLAAPQLMQVPLRDQTFLFFGAGQVSSRHPWGLQVA